jgi:hypothetical protein
MGTGTLSSTIPNTTFLMQEMPILVVSHTSWDFQNQQMFTTSAPANVTFSYWGDEPFTISEANFAGTDADQFVLNVPVDFLPLIMEYGDYLTFPISFTPTSTGAKSARLLVTDQLQTTIIYLTGNGIDNSFKDFPFLYDFTPTTFPPIGWLSRSGWLPSSDPVTTTALSTTEQWNRNNFVNTATHPFGGAARLNVFGTSRNGWLISPLIDLDALEGEKIIAFDLALTANNSANPPAQTGVDKKLKVLISTDAGQTWSVENIVAIWDNTEIDDGRFSYNAIPHTGEKIVLDISEYSGIVRFAFYGESTVTNANTDIYVDNVRVSDVPIAPLFEIFPVSTSFGNQQIRTETAPRTFTITNWGTLDLDIQSLTIMGTMADNFYIVDYIEIDFPITIRSMETYQFSVVFAPMVTGPISANLVLFDNVSRAFRSVLISGTGTDASVPLPLTENFNATTWPPTNWLTRTGVLPASGSLATTSLLATGTSWTRVNFMNTAAHVNQTAARITNSGTFTPAAIQGWFITPLVDLDSMPGDISFEFELVRTANNNANAPANVGNDRRFMVLISTDAGATWSASNIIGLWENAVGDFVSSGITRGMNSVTNAPQIVSIPLDAYSGIVRFAFYVVSNSGGTGTHNIFVDNVRIREVPSEPAFVVSPTSRDFGVLTVGQNASQTFTIRNDGAGGNLIIDSIVLDNDEHYSITNNNTLPHTILPDGTMTFSVTFSPTASGLFETDIVITDNLVRAIRTIPLSGSGWIPNFIQIGSGSTFVHYPSVNFFRFSYTQVIYLQSEVGGPRTIDAIAFQWRGQYATRVHTIQVSIGHTDRTNFAGTGSSNWISAHPLTSVFSGQITFPQIANTWVEIPITPFLYNGVDNLVIAINKTDPSGPFDQGNEQFLAYSAGSGAANQRVMWVRKDPAPAYDPNNLPTAQAVATNVPNIRIFGTPFVPTVLNPPRNLVGTPGVGYATLTWDVPDDGSTGTLQGYTIYRNGRALPVFLTSNGFVDDEVTFPGSFTYFVKAHYTDDDGESVPSNSITVSPIEGDDIKFPVSNLTGSFSEGDVILRWNPAGAAGGVFSYSGNTFGNAIGAVTTPNDFEIVHRYTVTQLFEFGVLGADLTRVSFYPNHGSSQGDILPEYSIKIYTGGSAAPYDPGTLIHTQAIESYNPNVWNEIILTDPIKIPSDRELWIAIEIQQYDLGTPGAMDNTVHFDGFGNIIRWNNVWQTALNISSTFSGNWLIRGYAEIEGQPAPISKIANINAIPVEDQIISRTMSSVQNYVVDYNTTVEVDDTRALIGYRVYRGSLELTDSPISTTTYTEVNVPAGTHTYSVRAIYTSGHSMAVETVMTIGLNSPQNLVAIPGVNIVDLSWTAPYTSPGSVIRGYNIFRNGIRISQNLNALTFTDTNAAAWINYEYHVTAVYTEPVGESYPSNIATAMPRSPTFTPPRNLSSAFDGNEVTIEWNEPRTESFTFATANSWNVTMPNIGGTVHTSFSVAHRFTPEAIQDLGVEGKYLNRISFATNQQQPSSTFTLKVWTREIDFTGDPTEIYSQLVTGNVGAVQWNSVPLDEPIKIPSDKEIWIGYLVHRPAGDARATADWGPMVDTFGNMMHILGSWMTLFEAGGGDAPVEPLRYNWMIRSYAVDLDDPTNIIAFGNDFDVQKLTPAMEFVNRGTVHGELVNATFEDPINVSLNNDYRSSQTYNVYRLEMYNNSANWQLLTPTPTNLLTYVDKDIDAIAYSYRVTAVYIGGIESAPLTTFVSTSRPEDVIITSFPWSEDFNTTIFPPPGWTMVDADEDDQNWYLHNIGRTGTAAASRSVGIHPDNWLISPKIRLANPTIGYAQSLSYWVAGTGIMGAILNDFYGVYISTGSNDIGDFRLLHSELLDIEEYENRRIDLRDYEGLEIYIAFRHFDTVLGAGNILRIDDVLISEVAVDVPKVTVSPIDMNFGYIALNVEHSQEFVITNTGRGELIVGELLLRTDYIDEFTINRPALPALLQPGQSVSFEIKLQTDAVYTYTASVQVVTNIGDRTVNIRGRAVHAIPPGNLLATSLNQGVMLRWERPHHIVSGELVGYNLYRDSILITTEPLNIDTFEYLDTNVSVGATYEYTVTASFIDPVDESDHSDPYTITVTVNTPTGLIASLQNNDVTLTWNAPIGELSSLIGYHIYHETERLTTTPIEELTYPVSDVPNGPNTFGVTAVYQIGESTAYITQINVNYFVYNPPKNFVATQTQFTVMTTWDVPDAGVNEILYGYRVYRDNVAISGSLYDITYFIDTNIVAGAEYTYLVRALYVQPVNAIASSDADVITIYVPAPTDVIATVDNSTVTVTWTAADVMDNIHVSTDEIVGSVRAFIGYRVYRDGVLLTHTTITDLSYEDFDVPKGKYIYSVVANYSIGDSETAYAPEVEVDTVSDIDIVSIVKTELIGNHPNPFNPMTTIQFAVKEEGHVRIEIYNIKGQRIKTLVDGRYRTGIYSVTWNGTDGLNRSVGSGIYLYHMVVGDYSSIRRMTLIK